MAKSISLLEEFVVALQIDQGGDLGALAILNAGG
jgi:hypothetical protein